MTKTLTLLKRTWRGQGNHFNPFLWSHSYVVVGLRINETIIHNYLVLSKRNIPYLPIRTPSLDEYENPTTETMKVYIRGGARKQNTIFTSDHPVSWGPALLGHLPWSCWLSSFWGQELAREVTCNHQRETKRTMCLLHPLSLFLCSQNYGFSDHVTSFAWPVILVSLSPANSSLE